MAKKSLTADRLIFNGTGVQSQNEPQKPKGKDRMLIPYQQKTMLQT